MGWPPNLAGRAERPSALTVSITNKMQSSLLFYTGAMYFEIENISPAGHLSEPNNHYSVKNLW